MATIGALIGIPAFMFVIFSAPLVLMTLCLLDLVRDYLVTEPEQQRCS